MPAGTTIALVGENGAGKTTLVKLLLRFYDPISGRIRVDGTDLVGLNLEAWRAGITPSFQDYTRFNFLAREAIGIGDLKLIDDRDAIMEAAGRAGATRALDNLPNGLETQLGREFPGGADLSEGQHQAIALARASMRTRPRLVVLDEPTASLDAMAEAEVFRRFVTLGEGDPGRRPITLLISHRFSTVRMADLIVVMHEGRVEAVGTHEELLEAEGRYAELYRMQAARYE